jgi:peptidoglycan/LPS O-acetylase OafA/YrhL
MQLIDKPQNPVFDIPSPAPKPRLDWVDNLRTAMIVLVVNMHACVTYSFVGSWYYNAPVEPPLKQKIPFLIWQGHLQAFFMGLLFFIAGYYADRALTRRGPAGFVKERLRRLGIPTLIYMLAIHPLIVMGLHPGYEPSKKPLADYIHSITSGRFIGNSGPMWFAFALLIFSLIFAAASKLAPKANRTPFNLKAIHLLALGAGLAVASFLVRTFQPIGVNILNMQLCFFSQYVAVFALGIWASRRDCLAALAASPVAKKAGLCALILGPIALGGVAALSMPLPEHTPPPFFGGWNLPALAFAAWEQITGVALGIGAIYLFAKRWNFKTPLSQWLSDRSFGVYLLHPPILVALALAAQPYRTNALVMSIALTVAGLAISYALADLARRIPLLRSVL